MSTNVTKNNYEDTTGSSMGFCPVCCEFTREETEPDADGYDCPVCGESQVVGAENALVLGLIGVSK